MKLHIPEPMKKEHEELHATLATATKLSGRLGEAAKKVAATLHPHFVREEEIALPPLGLLTRLAKGEVNPEMKEVLLLTDKLEKELPRMLAEHQQIVKALKEFAQIALEEGEPEYAAFAEKLMLHAQTEEEVSYPAALLIGRYVKTKLAQLQAV